MHQHVCADLLLTPPMIKRQVFWSKICIRFQVLRLGPCICLYNVSYSELTMYLYVFRLFSVLLRHCSSHKRTHRAWQRITRFSRNRETLVTKYSCVLHLRALRFGLLRLHLNSSKKAFYNIIIIPAPDSLVIPYTIRSGLGISG